MKILQVLNHFLPYQTAGTEVYVWTLSKHLQQLNFEISVLIPNYGAQQNETYEYDGLVVVKYAEPSIPDRALITGQKVSEGLSSFIQYLKEQTPDIVHFHEIAGSNGISIAHIEAAKALGIKVVFTMHLASSTCSTGTLMYKGIELCDGIIDEFKCARCVLIKKTGSEFKASLLLALSRLLCSAKINSLAWQNSIGTALSVPFQIKALRDKLKRITEACDKIIPITKWYHRILIENGVPLNKMKVVLQALPTTITKTFSSDRKATLPLHLIFIGRIDTLKGIPLLIDVVMNLSTDQIRLDIFGSTADIDFLDKCKSLTASCTHIRWMGRVKQEVVVETINKYDALILPSTFSEMSPLVIQEAFAAGIPVIGSNVYGIAEQVERGVNGWLFQFEDKAALKKLLLSLMADPTLIDAIKNKISNPNSFNEVALAYKNIYNEIMI